MTVPDWWVLALLGLASFRTWHILAEETILDRPREWLEGKAEESERWEYVHTFLVCPWCLGFWITLAWYGAWQATAHWTLVAAAFMAATVVTPALSKLLAD